MAWLLADQYREFGHALAGLAHARLWLVVAAFSCERVSMFAAARIQRRLLRAGRHDLSLRSALGITFAGNALSVTVPVIGAGLSAAFTYAEFARHKVSRPAATFTLAVSGALSTGALLVILAVGALLSGNTVAAILGLLAAAGVVAGIAGAVLALRVPAARRALERAAAGGVRLARRLRRKASESQEPPGAVVARALEQLTALRLRRRDWARLIVWAFVNWLADAGCLSLSVRAAGAHLPFDHLLVVWSAGVAVNSAGLTPGGAGIVEATLIAALAGFGISAGRGAVAVVIYRLISLWLVLLIGWIVFAAIRSRRGTQAAAEQRR